VAKEYSIRLIARNEGLEYRDAHGVYRFQLGRDGREWILYLPPIPEIRDANESLVIDRVKARLSKIWWLGFFPSTYTVRTEKAKALKF
jgi:hypothetical protein